MAFVKILSIFTLFFLNLTLLNLTPVFALTIPSSAPLNVPMCGQFQYFEQHAYGINNNLWGAHFASTGSQCTTIHSLNASGVSWSTTWNWRGGEGMVKSYANAGKIMPRGVRMDGIKGMPVSIEWGCKHELVGNVQVKADVAMDVFTARDKDHVISSGDYEVMVWFANIGGAWPIGPKIANVSINEHDWDLYKGLNGAMTVWSFLPSDGSWKTKLEDFDVINFYKYLEEYQGYPMAEQHLITFQQGTEPFTTTGAAPITYEVKHYSADIVLK